VLTFPRCVYPSAAVQLVQGYAIAPLLRRWSEQRLIEVCLLGLALSHVATGLAPTFTLWCALMPFVAFFGGVLRTCVVGWLSKSVAQAQVGAMLGLTGQSTVAQSGSRLRCWFVALTPALCGVVVSAVAAACLLPVVVVVVVVPADFLTSACRVVCPFVGGLLIQFLGYSSLDFLVTVLTLSTAYYLSRDRNWALSKIKRSTSGNANGNGAGPVAVPLVPAVGADRIKAT
jgi:hypothetical protein